MKHSIQIKNLSLSFKNKICFQDFSCQINYGDRIAIIGRNGSGKSSLLKILATECNSHQQLVVEELDQDDSSASISESSPNILEPSSGEVKIPEVLISAYVAQVIDEYKELSGGQRFNKALTSALGLKPDLLLLDEPTNHLDASNRKKLMHMLRAYSGTLIVVSHDTELLRACIDIIWHFDNGRIQVFLGGYQKYIRYIEANRVSNERQLNLIKDQKRKTEKSLLEEQKKVLTTGNKGKRQFRREKLESMNQKRKQLAGQMENLIPTKIILPKFSLTNEDFGHFQLIQVTNGSVGYSPDKQIVSGINLSVYGKDRVAILGDNGSGKSTLIKCILNEDGIYKKGKWSTPNRSDIGYLDQHYSLLDEHKTVLEAISDLGLSWSDTKTRKHLSDFLFQKSEQVNSEICNLSGGEKARLSLAKIAAITPKLLILDEITNNLDLETKEHIVQVLKEYPGAMMLISHDADFLKKIGISDSYSIKGGNLSLEMR